MPIRRALGVAGIAVLVLIAWPAAGAGAEVFQAGAYTSEISGQQEETHVLTIESGLTLQCKTATLEGELFEPAEEIHEVSPSFGNCTFSSFAATVANEGCGYTLDAGSNVIDIACPSEKGITVTAGTCEFKLGPQTSLSTVEYTTVESSPKTVSMNENVTGLKYTITKDGFLCPLAGTGEKTGGTLKGKLQLKAIFEAAQTALFLAPLEQTLLCSQNVSPCKEKRYTIPGTFEIELKSATFEFVLTKAKTVTCAEGLIKGDTALPAFNSGRMLNFNTSVFSFNKCNECSPSVLRPYAYFVTQGNGNGRFDIVGTKKLVPEIAVDCGGGEACRFIKPAVWGNVTGGNPAKIAYTNITMNLIVATSHKNCQGELTFNASYEFSKPTAAWLTY